MVVLGQLKLIFKKKHIIKMTPKITKAGVILLCKKYTTKVLLVKGNFSQKWGFPKGDIERGETAKRCAYRECLEETGHKLTNIVNGVNLEIGGDTPKIFYVSITDDYIETVPQHSEISDIRWFDMRELSDNKSLFTYDTRFLYRILNGTVKGGKFEKLKRYINTL